MPTQARQAVAPPPGPTLTWVQHGHPQQRRHADHSHARHGNGWGWLVLGLGALFLLKGMWWLLFIPALFGFANSCSTNQHASNGQQRQALVWIVGLGVLIATGWWVPGIFVVWLIASKTR